MKVKMLSDRRVGGKAVKKGSMVEVSDQDGRFLVATGKAEKSAKKAEK